jgi:hypothetical protein
MRKNPAAGFSLLELVISLSLSTIVLIGVISMAAQVIRNEYGTIKTGEVSALTLNGLDAMNRELEKASYIAPGLPAAGGGKVISACMNYSTIMAATPGINAGTGSLDGGAIKSFYYCIRDSGTPGRFDSLLRYPPYGSGAALYGTTCPYTPPASCGAGTFDVIIGNNISLMDGYGAGNYFQRDDTVGGIRMHYIIGNSTASTTAAAGTVAMPIPVAYKFDTWVTLSKSYQITGD